MMVLRTLAFWIFAFTLTFSIVVGFFISLFVYLILYNYSIPTDQEQHLLYLTRDQITGELSADFAVGCDFTLDDCFTLHSETYAIYLQIELPNLDKNYEAGFLNVELALENMNREQRKMRSTGYVHF